MRTIQNTGLAWLCSSGLAREEYPSYHEANGKSGARRKKKVIIKKENKAKKAHERHVGRQAGRQAGR